MDFVTPIDRLFFACSAPLNKIRLCLLGFSQAAFIGLLDETKLTLRSLHLENTAILDGSWDNVLSWIRDNLRLGIIHLKELSSFVACGTDDDSRLTIDAWRKLQGVLLLEGENEVKPGLTKLLETQS